MTKDDPMSYGEWRRRAKQSQARSEELRRLARSTWWDKVAIATVGVGIVLTLMVAAAVVFALVEIFR